MASSKWREFFLILLLSFPFIFWGIGSIRLLDPDEGMYGAIAREMAEKGDWITPHFNGVRYLEKPPLYFWLTAITISLFGPSEWAVRLWSALPALGTALLVWRLGRLLYGGPSGLLSAIILLTSVGVFRYTRVAATDSLLVFSLALSLYGFVRAVQDKNPGDKSVRFGPFLFYLGMALGVLSKGLVGGLFPLLIAGLYLWFSGDRIAVKEMQLKWGVVLLLALVLPWHFLAGWINRGFFEFYVLDNQFLRFFSSRGFIEDDVPVSTIAFVALTFIWFFPWSMFLSMTLPHGFPDPRLTATARERLRLLVGLWAITVFAFFSFSSSKLEHYVLPALPPLSLMVGALWGEAFSAAGPARGFKWLLAASALGCGLVGAALILLGDRLTPGSVFTWLAEINVYYRILREQGISFPFSSVAPFASLARGLGVGLVIGVPLSFVLFYLGARRASFGMLVGVAALTGILIFRLLLIIEPHHSAKPIALALNTLARPEEAIIHEGSLEYSGSLPFYTGRQISVLNGKRGDLDFGSRYPEAQGAFLDDMDFARRWQNEERVFFVTRLQEPDNAPIRLALKNTFLLGRYGSRLLYSNYGP